MLYSRHLLFALVCCFSFLYGLGQKLVQPRIHVRTEVHQDRVLLRWVASDAKSWQLLNKYGVKLKRLTVARDGVLLDKPEVALLAEQLRPMESDRLKVLVDKYPMGLRDRKSVV